MGKGINKALWEKLLGVQSAQEAAELLRANGAEYSEEEASQIWQEIERCKAKGKEEAVFTQDLSSEEMESVSGGRRLNIYDGGFPNCAATVESGSWCGSNDACHTWSIIYVGMSDCSKAWK